MAGVDVKSRRAILGAAAGAAAAVAANALVAPGRVLAEGQNVQVGGEYTDATSVTLIKNSSSGSTAQVFRAEHSGPGTALFGQSTNGRGVQGEGGGLGAASIGVYGTGFVGVEGVGSIGARFTGNGIGGAVQLFGRAIFSGSGIATMPAGRSSLVVKPPNPIYDPTFILAVLLQYRAGVWVAAVIPRANEVPAQFTIRLNKAVGSATRIGWFAVN